MANQYTADQMEHHLTYEIDMLSHTYDMIPIASDAMKALGRSEQDQIAAQNAMIEAFCTHARVLVEFFVATRTNSAATITDNTYVKPSIPDFNQLLNNQIAHLMDRRTADETLKISDDDRMIIFNWISTELRRMRGHLNADYSGISIPSLPLYMTVTSAAGASSSVSATSFSNGPAGPIGPSGKIGATVPVGPATPPATNVREINPGSKS